MHEIGASAFWTQWGRTLERVDRLEEGLTEVRAELAQWQVWARRGVLLAAIWGSVVAAGINHELASTIVAALIKSILRYPGSAG